MVSGSLSGGAQAFAQWLAEEAGVPRHVWLALPIDARYTTPAAELYQRRLKAFMSGDDALPTDLRPTLPPLPDVHEAGGAVIMDV